MQSSYLSARLERGTQIFFLGVLACLFLYLGYMTRLFQVNPFDTYELLLNARRYAGVDEHPIYWKRPPFLPLLLTPFFWLEARFFERGFAEIAGRYLALFFYLSFLWVGYRLLVKHLNRITALAMVFLLGINRLMIHHAPFTKEDAPSSLFTVCTFYFYLRAGETRKLRYFLLTCFFMIATITTRYNLVPLLFFVIAVYEFASGSTRLGFKPGAWGLLGHDTWKKIFYFLILPASSIIIVPSLVYAAIGYAPLLEAPVVFLKEIVVFFELLSERSDSFIENYEFMLIAGTPPVVILMLFGTVSVIIKRERRALLYIIWFFSFFIVGTYFVSIREGRYLMPFLLPFYYLAGAGLEQLWQTLSEIFEKRKTPEKVRQAVFAGTLALIAAWPIQTGVAEALKFQDPFYTRNFSREVAEYAKREAGENNRVYWVGAKYPLFPRDHIFHIEDEFAYIYHYYNHVIRFYLGERCFAIGFPEFAYPAGGKYGVFVPRIGASVPDGTVLIINPMPEDYRTNSLPEKIAPLVIERVHTYPFVRVTPPQEALQLFMSQKLGGARTAFAPQTADGKYYFEGIGIPDGAYEIYLQLPGRERPDFYQIVEVQGGAFKLENQEIFPQAVESLFLLNYEPLKFMAHPDMPVQQQ